QLLVQVLFPLSGDGTRRWAARARGALAVTAVQLLDDVHAVGDLAERGEALRIQASVITEIDEDLCGSGVASGGGKCYRSRFVALGYGIGLDIGGPPDRAHLRVGVH